MSSDLENYQASMQDSQMAYEEALMEYRNAQRARNPERAQEALLRMSAQESIMNGLNSILSKYQAAQRPAAASPGSEDMSRGDVTLAQKYGLTSDELRIAKNWTSDPNLSPEDRVRQYTENRTRYRQMRADGTYRDDQGRVTR